MRRRDLREGVDEGVWGGGGNDRGKGKEGGKGEGMGGRERERDKLHDLEGRIGGKEGRK